MLLTNKGDNDDCVVGKSAESEDAQWIITPDANGSQSLVIKSVKDLSHFSVWCESVPKPGKSWGYSTHNDNGAADRWTIEQHSATQG